MCVVTGGSDESDNEENKVTFSYKSKRQAEREGLEDMGATLTLETETKTKVCQIMNTIMEHLLVSGYNNY